MSQNMKMRNFWRWKDAGKKWEKRAQNWGELRTFSRPAECIWINKSRLSLSLWLGAFGPLPDFHFGGSRYVAASAPHGHQNLQSNSNFFRPMQIKVEWRPRLFSFETSRSVHSAKVWFCVRLERQLPAHTVRRFIYLFRRCELRYTDRDSSDMFTQTERWARCTRVLCNQKENTQRVFYLTQVVRWFQK